MSPPTRKPTPLPPLRLLSVLVAASIASTAHAEIFDKNAPRIAGAVASQPVAAYDSAAPFAFMIDADTGAVLYARNADERMPPSSMGKMMTAHVVFDMLNRGEIKLTDQVRVSDDTWRAWNNRGSTMFLEAGEVVTVEALLHGIVTLSGNDACVVLAEGLMGNEATFVQRMNETARRLGMKGSHFANTTGWPDPEEYVTPRDLARLARATITEFPALYGKFYATPDFTRSLTEGKTIAQDNRNPILGIVPGADGLKTGHTEAAGFGFTGSAVQNGRRLIIVVNGLTSMAERRAESAKFITWGFRAFDQKTLVKAGGVVAQAPVWLGAAPTVPLVAVSDVRATIARGTRGAPSGRLVYSGPIAAPVRAGQVVGRIEVRQPGGALLIVPVRTATAVDKAGLFGKIAQGFGRLFFGSPVKAAQ